MKYSLYIFLLFWSTVIFAQDLTISGVLLDEQNRPIPYANILCFEVVNLEVNQLKGMSSNDEGLYKFEGLKPGKYIIKASFLGYETGESTLELFKNTSLDPIILKATTENIGEVIITTKRPTLKKESDRLIFNIANTSLSEGSILEVLKRTPGVLIFDNEISVKNTTPTIYINNRKVNLSSSELTQLLENSSANSIQKIEVITNPSARYDADNGAVLNIVMLKNLITGYRGNVFANFRQGVFSRYNAGISQFYKTKKVSLNANYSASKNKINRNNEEKVNYLDANNNINERWDSRLNRNTWSETHNLSFNFDYLINDKNTLSLSSNLLFLPYFKYLTNGESIIFDANDDINFRFDSHNLSRDKKHNLGFDLDFVHKLDSKSTLSINSHLTAYDYDRDQMVNSNYFDANNAFDFRTIFRTNSNQNTDIFTTQIDYDLSLENKASFSAGLKSSNIKTKSDIVQLDIDPNTGEQTLNVNNTNDYSYKESIFAGYISFDKRWEAWRFSAGLRAEHTHIEGKSVHTSEKNNQDYLELFPTLNISYQVSDQTTVYTNFKRSIGRPSYKSLNPFNFFLNDNTIVSGNPTLQPTFTNRVLIGTTVSDYNIELYYKDTKSNIFELPLQNNTDNIIIYSPINLNKTREFGLDFTTSFDLKENWSVYLYTSIYNIQDETVFNNNAIKADQWTNYTTLSNSLSFLKDKSLSLDFGLTYISKNQSGFRRVAPRLISDLSVKKKIFNKKGTLSLAVNDLFNMQDFEIISKYANQDNFNFRDLDNRYIRLGFSYKFGNTTLKTNQRTKSSSERNRLNN
ncbi:TonB-dependent receptor domain-containing protein [Pontimicrobium sp. MEBiC01747]